MFYIRADANHKIGSGHVMRCLAIATAMQDRGYDCTFITADQVPEQLIKSHGFTVLCLHSIWDDLDMECNQFISLIKKRNIEHILIDSYFVTENYLAKIRQFTKITYLDDLDKFRYPADNLINYNIYADQMPYQEEYKETDTKLLLGCSFVPLRAEFRNCSPVVRDEVKNILITTGGSDPFNVAGNLLIYLNRETIDLYSSLRFHVIVGSFNPHQEILKTLGEKYDNIELHYNVTEISKLMLYCDLAISAGGSTLYELCSCGIPTVCYAFADNQLEGIEEFNRRELIFSVGDIRTDQEECYRKMEDRLRLLIGDKHLREELSNRMKKLVDGFGAQRIVDQIL